jgi:hypothetical protein
MTTRAEAHQPEQMPLGLVAPHVRGHAPSVVAEAAPKKQRGLPLRCGTPWRCGRLSLC